MGATKKRSSALHRFRTRMITPMCVAGRKPRTLYIQCSMCCHTEFEILRTGMFRARNPDTSSGGAVLAARPVFLGARIGERVGTLNARVHRTESVAICRLADRQMRERDQSSISSME